MYILQMYMQESFDQKNTVFGKLSRTSQFSCIPHEDSMKSLYSAGRTISFKVCDMLGRYYNVVERPMCRDEDGIIPSRTLQTFLFLLYGASQKIFKTQWAMISTPVVYYSLSYYLHHLIYEMQGLKKSKLQIWAEKTWIEIVLKSTVPRYCIGIRLPNKLNRKLPILESSWKWLSQ